MFEDSECLVTMTPLVIISRVVQCQHSSMRHGRIGLTGVGDATYYVYFHDHLMTAGIEGEGGESGTLFIFSCFKNAVGFESISLVISKQNTN